MRYDTMLYYVDIILYYTILLYDIIRYYVILYYIILCYTATPQAATSDTPCLDEGLRATSLIKKISLDTPESPYSTTRCCCTSRESSNCAVPGSNNQSFLQLPVPWQQMKFNVRSRWRDYASWVRGSLHHKFPRLLPGWT